MIVVAISAAAYIKERVLWPGPPSFEVEAARKMLAVL